MHRTEYVPEGWLPSLWDELNAFAESNPTSELIAFILLAIAQYCDEKCFRRWLKDIAGFSRNDLLEVLDELDPEVVSKLLVQLTSFKLNRRHD